MVVAGAARNRAATGPALVNSFRQISAAVGVAVLVTFLGTRVTVDSVADFRPAWVLDAVLGLATAPVGVTLRGRSPHDYPARLAGG